MPADALSYPPAMLDGIRVRTVSPLTLYQVRAALADVFGGMRPRDYAVQPALHDRFLSHLSEADLRPRVEAVLTQSPSTDLGPQEMVAFGV
jgi:hypothetical protein